MTHKNFGLRIVHGTINYFITSADQALPQHKVQAIEAFGNATKSDRSVLITDSNIGLTISACRTYAEIDPYVVLQDIDPQEMDFGIFSTKWVPETPVPLDCDYKGRKRFKVLDFCSDASEAAAVVKALKDQEERK